VHEEASLFKLAANLRAADCMQDACIRAVLHKFCAILAACVVLLREPAARICGTRQVLFRADACA
jgi:hypothetical protein